MIHRIILDVDDVLNSLTLHILRHYGCDVDVYDYAAFPIGVGYDIITACELLSGRVPFIKGDQNLGESEYIHAIPSFWDTVTAANLWRTVPKSPECDWLIASAADIVGRESVYIATSPTKDPQSHADKLHWMWDNLPSWIHRQYFITPRKWLLGKPGVILFDDHVVNCEKFKAEGGDAFLVPRPWNPRYSQNTEDALVDCLERIRKNNK